jgi:hypothetical protein
MPIAIASSRLQEIVKPLSAWATAEPKTSAASKQPVKRGFDFKWFSFWLPCGSIRSIRNREVPRFPTRPSGGGAFANATGVRLRELPFTPARVKAALT